MFCTSSNKLVVEAGNLSKEMGLKQPLSFKCYLEPQPLNPFALFLCQNVHWKCTPRAQILRLGLWRGIIGIWQTCTKTVRGNKGLRPKFASIFVVFEPNFNKLGSEVFALSLNLPNDYENNVHTGVTNFQDSENLIRDISVEN